MKIKELVDLIGVYEPVRVTDSEFEELCRCAAIDLPAEIGELFIKSVYCHNSTINIISALDKRRRKWYNKTGNNAE